MTIREFIDEYYPIRDIVKRITTDPVTKVMEMDDLPFDEVIEFDGVLQKVVYTSSHIAVPVIELLGTSERDVEKLPDGDEYKELYKIYMENVSVTNIQLEELMGLSKAYLELKQKRRELCNVQGDKR